MDGCCQLKFVVELATREDSHKKLTKQPVTLSAAFRCIEATSAFPPPLKTAYSASEALYSHHCRPLALIPHQHQESALRRLSGSEIGQV